MEAKDFRIDFLNPTFHFSPGDKIAGYVTFSLLKSTNIEKIEILFKGFSHVNWKKAISIASPPATNASQQSSSYPPSPSSLQKNPSTQVESPELSSSATFSMLATGNSSQLNDFQEYLNQKTLLYHQATVNQDNYIKKEEWELFDDNCHKTSNNKENSEMFSHHSTLPIPSHQFGLPLAFPATIKRNCKRKSHQPGLHRYPFSIQLPNDLPESFVGDYGFLRYVSVALIFPMQSSKRGSRRGSSEGKKDSCSSGYSSAGDARSLEALVEDSKHQDLNKATNEVVFFENGAENKSALSAETTVANGKHCDSPMEQPPYDVSDKREGSRRGVLSAVQEFVLISKATVPLSHMKPVEIAIKKKRSLMLFKLCYIKGFWKLNKTGFLAGEKINVFGNFENRGRLRVARTKVTLVQITTYHSFTCSHSNITQRKKLLSKSKAAILPSSSGFWREPIEIPACAAVSTHTSKPGSIHIKYTLKLVIEFESCFKPITYEVDLFIGNSYEPACRITQGHDSSETINYFN